MEASFLNVTTIYYGYYFGFKELHHLKNLLECVENALKYISDKLFIKKPICYDFAICNVKSNHIKSESLVRCSAVKKRGKFKSLTFKSGFSESHLIFWRPGQ